MFGIEDHFEGRLILNNMEKELFHRCEDEETRHGADCIFLWVLSDLLPM